MIKICSWNLLIDNQEKQIQSFRSLVEDAKPDIMCLQEVSEPLLSWLHQKNEYHISSCTGFIKKLKGKEVNSYLVILSKYRFLSTKNSATHSERAKSLATQIFGVMAPREYQYVDIEVASKKYRIFNLHLEVASGTHRRQMEFGAAARHMDDNATNIICGDFNIFSNPWIAILIGWLFSFKHHDYFVDERTEFEDIFRTLELINPFRHKITYPTFRLQLDHILIQKGCKFNDVTVFSSTYGSDHHPISLSIDN